MGTAYSVTSPVVVIRPICPAAGSVNQRLPSGPGVMSPGWLNLALMGNSMIAMSRVICPILSALPPDSVN